LEGAGVKPRGKCGPHVFRHARAVTLLRASVSRKVIGDLLGHRSEEATLPYLKLATEDLRAIALEIPEARS
jgi:site-specific recombinase XerD